LTCLLDDQAGEQGVINMSILAKIRQMHLRDGMSLREVAKRTGLSRNTIRVWLRQAEVIQPTYPTGKPPNKVYAWASLLVT
jgi:transposase-like protein